MDSTATTEAPARRPLGKAYPIRGTMSEAERLTDDKGRPFLKGLISYVKADGEPKKVRAMAFGIAVNAVQDAWNNGRVELYGTYESGGCIRIISKAFPKETAQ